MRIKGCGSFLNFNARVMMKWLAIFFILTLPALQSFGQRTCATDLIYNETYSNPQKKQAFENWLRDKLNNRKAVEESSRTQETTYQIPVVVHVIHNGEPEGLGSNIPDEQIFAQIEVLNEDFNRLNADSVNTPEVFQPLASKIHFEFILARQSPDGLATNGIVRKQGSQTSWQGNNFNQLMSESYWPPENYLNIWVANISDFLGYATYPESDIEDGLPANQLQKEGVLVSYGAFGSRIKYPAGNYEGFDFDLGRTATHELGHYFGLRHIWGDGGCGVDDYVADTPESEGFYDNCPSLGVTSTSCGSQDMFMNYMDYVDDDCMNIFSIGQRDRMHVIINNSPNRLSLSSSPGLEEPLASDARLVSINSPQMGVCDAEILTNVTVQNTGSLVINLLKLEITLDDSSVLTETFNVNIPSLESADLTFSSFSLLDYGIFDFRVAIVEVNGAPEDNPINNTLNLELVRAIQTTELDESFETWPSNWELRTDGSISAINLVNSISDDIDNLSAKLGYFGVTATSDALQTPLVDLSGFSEPHLLVLWSYAHRQDFDDNLSILASNNCGASFDVNLFNASGADLSTAEHPIQFSPANAADWGFQSIDLSALSSGYAQFAFVGNSLGGNNLYLDDIRVVDSSYEDLALLGLADRVGVYCSPVDSLDVIIENRGVTTIESTSFDIIINGTRQTFSLSNLSLASGERQVIGVPANLPPGSNEVLIELNSDPVAGNNTLTSTLEVQLQSVELPIRESFRTPNEAKTKGWRSFSPNHPTKWEVNTLNDGYAIRYPAYSDTRRGAQSYLVSPLLDFAVLAEASLRFNVAYARNGDKNELLRVWAAQGCDETFDLLLAEFDKNELTTAASSQNWSPQSVSDWRQLFVSLDTLVGKSDVRLAFEVTNDNGNNLFLDDIEILITDDPEEVQVAKGTVACYPNPVTNGIVNLTFNLPAKERTEIAIVNTMGQLVKSYELSGVLNQTYDLDLTNLHNGIYLIEIRSEVVAETFRVIIDQ